MDELTEAKWQSLVEGFRLKKSGASPWDANKLEANCEGASHGELHAIAFLLNVWDGSRDWKCGKFDAIGALSIWDEEARATFIKWATNPFWP